MSLKSRRDVIARVGVVAYESVRRSLKTRDLPLVGRWELERGWEVEEGRSRVVDDGTPFDPPI